VEQIMTIEGINISATEQILHGEQNLVRSTNHDYKEGTKI
jgi:hypothetical protein